MLLEINDAAVSRGGNEILKGFSFEIRGTEKIAIVGKNGAGKTTLLEVIAGTRDIDKNEKNPASGMRRSRAFTVGMLHQQAVDDPDASVEESILKAAGDGRPEGWQYTDARYDFETRFDRMFTNFGFAKEDKGKKLGSFSGGEQIKIMLIRLLLAQPDVLILDEPTNHLDLASVTWLERYVRSYPKAVVMVSHDRYFMDACADVIWEISGGKLIRYPGNYTNYRAEKAKRAARQMKMYEREQEEIERLNGLIEEYKAHPRKAAFARSRKKMLERMPRTPKPETGEAQIHTGDIIPLRRPSKWVYECENLKIGYNGVPIKEITLRIRRGQKIGVIGPNGSGKSTFLKTVAGVIPPAEPTGHFDPDESTGSGRKVSGTGAAGGGKVLEAGAAGGGKTSETVKGDSTPVTREKYSALESNFSHLRGKAVFGNHVDMAYFDQKSAEITSEKNVFDYFHDQFPAMTEEEVRKCLAGYLFHGRDLGKKVKNLSGGEKARLVLAALLETKPNFLVLDEPTNNMDIPAKETLESVFKDYRGTILFVSHDRYFLKEVADSLIVFEPGASPVMFYPFGYENYAEKKRKGTADEDIAAMRTAEEQRMIDSLRAVPEGERHHVREITTKEATLDWEFDLNRVSREKAEMRYAAAEEALTAVPETEEAYKEWKSKEEARQKEADAALGEWTGELLNWYDIWLSTRAAHLSE